MSLAAALVVSGGDFTLDLALAVESGRTLALLGPNGAGKSTALAALAGTLPAFSNGQFGLVQARTDIRLNGRQLDEVPVEKRRIGFVFQDYLLFPHLTVLENVAFGSTKPRAGEWIERLGISDLASSRPAQLSGGQSQRVALARALATDPELLLLDEPLAALDVEIRDEMRGELARHLDDWGGLTIVVTHSFEDVAALAKDVVVVEKGLATQRGTVRDIVRAPATTYVERLVRDWSDD